MQAIVLVVVGLSAVSDDAVVVSQQTPTPLVRLVLINLVLHNLGPFMVDDRHKTFLATYRHDGAEWGLELKARDADDAKARLRQLSFARLDGELIAEVPASLGPLAAVATFVRNGFARLLGAYQ